MNLLNWKLFKNDGNNDEEEFTDNIVKVVTNEANKLANSENEGYQD